MGRRCGLCALALAALVGGLAGPVSPALGAGKIYWADAGSGTIRVGNLNGTGARNLFKGETDPYGVALDPATGKIYWADFGSGAIRVGSLNGTGASSLFTGESSPMGVAIDPATGRLYWSDDSSGVIRDGKLNGTGASDLFTGENGPTGVAVDTANGLIYWGATGSEWIRVGNLTGTVASTLFSLVPSPFGVAIDQAVGKIYWGSYYGEAVMVGNLDGIGTFHNLFSSELQTEAVAIDEPAGKIYWTNDSDPGTIRVGNLNGTGASDLFSSENSPTFLAILLPPKGAGVPRVAGRSTVGSVLSCSRGTWAPDLGSASLYRAPRSFAEHWRLNGERIAGATSPKYVPIKPGRYSCQVTATNEAGSTTQTSLARAVSG